MNENRFRDIIGLVFILGKEKFPTSRNKSQLCEHLVKDFNISQNVKREFPGSTGVSLKTLKNYFDRYFSNVNVKNPPSENTVQVVLSYLYAIKNEAEIKKRLNAEIDFTVVPFAQQSSEEIPKKDEIVLEEKKSKTTLKKELLIEHDKKTQTTKIKPFYFGLAAIAMVIVSIAAFFFYSNVQIASDKNSKDTIQINAGQLIITPPKQVYPTNTDDFFTDRNEPKVWYTSNKDELEFYDTLGKHPKNGNILKPVTKEVVKTYLLKKEAIFATQNNTATTLKKEDKLNSGAISSDIGSEAITKNSKTAIKNKISIFVFDSITSLDRSFSKHLGSLLLEDYNPISNSIETKNLKPEVLQQLKNGDINYLKDQLRNDVDFVLLGNSTYSFGTVSTREDMVKCVLNFDYQIIATQTGKIIKSDTGIVYGNGFSKKSAKANTIKKINL